MYGPGRSARRAPLRRREARARARAGHRRSPRAAPSAGLGAALERVERGARRPRSGVARDRRPCPSEEHRPPRADARLARVVSPSALDHSRPSGRSAVTVDVDVARGAAAPRDRCGLPSCTSSTSAPPSTTRPGCASEPSSVPCRRRARAAPNRAPRAGAHRARRRRRTADSRRRGRTGRSSRRAGSPRGARRRGRAGSTFSRASASASGRRPWRRRSRRATPGRAPSAIAPVPVPTSRTRGAVDVRRGAPRHRSTTISVSGRGHERAAVGFQRQPPEAPVAQDVGERLARAAPAHRLRADSRSAGVSGRSCCVYRSRRVRPSARASSSSASSARCSTPCARGTSAVASRASPSVTRGRFERAALLVGGERVGELVEAPLEHLVEPVNRQLDPVIGDAVLRIVVGADLLRARAGSDLRAPGRSLLGGEPLPLGLVQARAQDAHRLLPVLQLRPLVLHRDDDAARQVGDPHGRVGRVDALAAGPRRAVDVDLQILLVDLDIDLLRLRHHGDRGRRGVDATLRLGLGHALHSMGSGFDLKTEYAPSPFTANTTSLTPPPSFGSTSSSSNLKPRRSA